ERETKQGSSHGDRDTAPPEPGRHQTDITLVARQLVAHLPGIDRLCTAIRRIARAVGARGAHHFLVTTSRARGRLAVAAALVVGAVAAVVAQRLVIVAAVARVEAARAVEEIVTAHLVRRARRAPAHHHRAVL